MGLVAFTDVPSLKLALGIAITSTGDDGKLRGLVDAANAGIARALQRNVLTASYTETRDGTGTKTLMLRNYPVTAVTSVTLTGPTSGGTAPATTLIQGRDYTFTKYALKLYAGVWCKAVANVIVVYTAGYASVPADLARAATKWAALRYRELDRLGQKSKILAGETVTYDLSEMPPDVENVVNRYTVGMALVDELQGTQ